MGVCRKKERKTFLKAGGMCRQEVVEQDLRFMSGKGSKKRKSDRGMSVQTGRLLPTPGTEEHRQHQAKITGIGCYLRQGHFAGTEFQGTWHWEDAGYPGTAFWPSRCQLPL